MGDASSGVVRALFPCFVEYESNFKSEPLVDYTVAHTEIPIFAVTLYLGMIFYLPQHLGEAPGKGIVRKAWGIWNLLLSIFSIVGASRTVPVLYDQWIKAGFVFTVCGGTGNSTGSQWYTTGTNSPTGLWVGLFIYSKLPELLDTAFLVIQKKQVIFLHWFHHVTVLLYCWHAYHHQVSTGLWFASMNYCVHSIMYLYYFIMIFPSPRTIRKAAQNLAPGITTIQIMQMIGGIIVTCTGWYHTHNNQRNCSVDAANSKLGLGMYASYCVLFMALFFDKFLKSRSEKSGAEAKNLCNASVSNDAAGFFHGNSPRDSRGRTSTASSKRGRSPSPSPKSKRQPSPSSTRARRSSKAK